MHRSATLPKSRNSTRNPFADKTKSQKATLSRPETLSVQRRERRRHESLTAFHLQARITQPLAPPPPVPAHRIALGWAGPHARCLSAAAASMQWRVRCRSLHHTTRRCMVITCQASQNTGTLTATVPRVVVGALPGVRVRRPDAPPSVVRRHRPLASISFLPSTLALPRSGTIHSRSHCPAFRASNPSLSHAETLCLYQIAGTPQHIRQHSAMPRCLHASGKPPQGLDPFRDRRRLSSCTPPDSPPPPSLLPSTIVSSPRNTLASGVPFAPPQPGADSGPPFPSPVCL